MTRPTPIANGFVGVWTLEIQGFLLLPLPALVRVRLPCRTLSCFLKSTKQSVASEMETKDLMGDSFKSRCARELCISLLQPASSIPGEGILKPVSEDLVFISASAVLCSDCSKRLRSRPSLWFFSFGFLS